VPYLGSRSLQSRCHPRPATPHWRGYVDTLRAKRLLGKSYPKGYRTDSSVRTWLSPVMNSAASQPNYAELLDSSSISRLLPLYPSLMRQGFFPPPALPGLNGNTSPSAICADRSHPSRAERCHHGCHHDHVQRRLPLLRTSSLACVLSPLPRCAYPADPAERCVQTTGDAAATRCRARAVGTPPESAAPHPNACPYGSAPTTQPRTHRARAAATAAALASNRPTAAAAPAAVPR